MLGISLHLAMPIMWKRWDLIRIDSNDSPFYRNFGDAQGNKVWHYQAIPSPNCYTPWVKAGRPQCPYRGLDMSVVCCLTQCWNPILFWGLDTIPNRKESLGHLQKRWSIMEPHIYNDRIAISNIPFNIDSSKINIDMEKPPFVDHVPVFHNGISIQRFSVSNIQYHINFPVNLQYPSPLWTKHIKHIPVNSHDYNISIIQFPIPIVYTI